MTFEEFTRISLDEGMLPEWIGPLWESRPPHIPAETLNERALRDAHKSTRASRPHLYTTKGDASD